VAAKRNAEQQKRIAEYQKRNKEYQQCIAELQERIEEHQKRIQKYTTFLNPTAEKQRRHAKIAATHAERVARLKRTFEALREENKDKENQDPKDGLTGEASHIAKNRVIVKLDARDLTDLTEEDWVAREEMEMKLLECKMEAEVAEMVMEFEIEMEEYEEEINFEWEMMEMQMDMEMDHEMEMFEIEAEMEAEFGK
jgi:hypothetical protein